MSPRTRTGGGTVGRVAARLARLLRLPVREQLTTLHAAMALAVVESLIRWVRLPRLAALAGVTLEPGPGARPPGAARLPGGARREDVRRAVRSARRVLRSWPFGSGPCLRESLVLGHLLRGRSPHLHIGVAPRGDRLQAHAWLEVDGEVLGDSRGFSTFGQPNGDGR